MFDSSFFSLYVYDGLMNVFTYFVGFFTMRLNNISCYDCLLASFYKNIGSIIPLNFVLAMIYHMAYVQYLITTLVSLNRFTVLYKSNVFEPIWKKSTWLFIVLIYFVPFLNTKVVFQYNSEFVFFEDENKYLIVSLELPVIKIFSVLIPFMVLTMAVTILFNIGSVIFLRGLNIQRKEAESKFLFITFITCTFQSVGTIISVPLSLLEVSPFLLTFSSLIVPFTSDGLTLVQPWLLLCFSTTMRNEVKKTLGWKSKVDQNKIFQIQSVSS